MLGKKFAIQLVLFETESKNYILLNITFMQKYSFIQVQAHDLCSNIVKFIFNTASNHFLTEKKM
jgi:hypothetical protein